jgi:hypothetical protein
VESDVFSFQVSWVWVFGDYFYGIGAVEVSAWFNKMAEDL